MASRPVQTTRIAELDELGEEEIFRLYVEHGSVEAMCRELFKAHGDGRPGVTALYRWLQETPERWAKWQTVKVQRADVEVDLAYVEAQAATPENVNVQRLKVDTHKWRAGIFNREYRSGQSSVNVNVGVQIGEAWLAALEKMAAAKAEVIE